MSHANLFITAAGTQRKAFFMRFIKQIVLVSIVICFCFKTSNAQKLQSFKYRITSMMGRNLDKGKWGDWFEPSSSGGLKDVLVVLDMPNKKFSFYTPKIQEFSVINLSDPKEDSEKSTFKFECVDSENRKCTLILIFEKERPLEPYLYHLYPTMELLYFLKSE